MFSRIAKLFRSSLFLQNSAILFVGMMIANVLSYVFHFVIGRMVTPTVYGEIESIVSLLTIIVVPATAISLVANRYASLARAHNDVSISDEVFRELNKRILWYGTPAFFVALLLTPWVADFLKIEHELAIVFLWSMMLVSFFSAVASGALAGWQKFFWVGAVNVVSSAFKLIFAVFFVLIGFAVDGIVGAFLLAGLSGYGLSLWVVRRARREYSREESKGGGIASVTQEMSVKQYAIPVLFGSLAVALLTNIDMVLAKYHLAPEVAGVYGALFIVSKTIYFAGGILSMVMFSMSAEEGERGKIEGNMSMQVFRNATILTSLFALLSVAFFALFPEFVLRVFFGAKYVEAAPYLWWFALASAVSMLAYFLYQYLLSQGKTRIVWWMLGVALVEILVLFFLGSTLVEIIAITLGAQVVALGVSIWFIWQNRGIEGKLEERSVVG